MGNLIALSTDIKVITAEINSYKQLAGQSIFEIGKRLKHVKENDLVHGEFGKWSESIGIPASDASRFIKVYDEVGGSKLGTYTNFGLKALYLIASMPEEEREHPHTIPSTGETKTVDEMTTKELQEVNKKLKQVEKENDKLSQQLEAERNKPQQVERVVEVDKTDYTQLQKLQREADSYKRKFESAERLKELLEERLQQEEADADAYRKHKNDMQRLQSQKGDWFRDMESATSISTLVVDIEHMLENKLAPVKYSRAINEQKHSPVVMENVLEMIQRIDEWSSEMKFIIGKADSRGGVIIDGEILEAEILS